MRATGYAAARLTLEQAVEDYVRNYLIPGRKLGDVEPAAAS